MRRLVLTIIFLIGSRVLASEPIYHNGVDIAPVVDFMKSRVLVTTKTFKMYNWSFAPRLANNPRAFESLKPRGEVFWDHFGERTAKDDEYGAGYYFAMDPLVSSHFGASRSPHWLLQVLNMPVGLHVLNLGDPENQKLLPVEIRKILFQLHCPDYSSLQVLFHKAGALTPIECQNVTQRIFSKIIPIDGFFYFYRGTPFAACSFSDPESPRLAFVATQSSWLQQDQITLFNEKTRTQKTERALLQSVLNNAGNKEMFFRDRLPKTPVEGSEESRARVFCGDSQCRLLEASKSSEKNRDESGFLFPVPAELKILNRKTAALFNLSLWNDLEGTAALPTDSWLRQNILGCDGELPFKPWTTGL